MRCVLGQSALHRMAIVRQLTYLPFMSALERSYVFAKAANTGGQGNITKQGQGKRYRQTQPSDLRLRRLCDLTGLVNIHLSYNYTQVGSHLVMLPPSFYVASQSLKPCLSFRHLVYHSLNFVSLSHHLVSPLHILNKCAKGMQQ